MVFHIASAVWPVVIWVSWILVYMAWGDLCSAAVPGSFGIVITAGSVHGLAVDYGIPFCWFSLQDGEEEHGLGLGLWLLAMVG